MPFDPDAYLAGKSSPGGFDPDAYLASKPDKKPIIDRAIDGANDFMTNLSDNPVGHVAGQAASYPAAALSGLWDDRPFDQRRQEMVQQDRQQYADAKARSPIMGNAGSLTGSVFSGPSGGGVIANAGVDAVMSGADSLSNGKDLASAGKDAAVSGLVSGAVGGAVKAVGKGIEMLAPSANSMANKLTVNALGGTPREQAILNRNTDEIGQLVRDNKIMKFGANAEGTAGRVDDAVNTIGQRIGDVRAKSGSMVDIGNLREGKVAEAIGKDGLAGAEQQQMNTYLKEIKDLPDAVSIDRSQELIDNYRKAVSKPGGPQGAAEQAHADLYGDIRKAQNSAIEGSVSPETFASYQKDMRNRYLLGGADTATNREAARAQANQTIGLKDLAAGAVIGGGLGYGSDNPTAGIAGAVAGSLARTRGAATAAWAGDKVANMVAKTPHLLGKFAPALQAAAARGQHSLATTTFLLQKQDPDFRKLMESHNESP